MPDSIEDQAAAMGYTLVFFAQWHDYEEGQLTWIFERNGIYFQYGDGHCVYDDEISDPVFPDDLEPITQDEALAEILEWEAGYIEFDSIGGRERA